MSGRTVPNQCSLFQSIKLCVLSVCVVAYNTNIMIIVLLTVLVKIIRHYFDTSKDKTSFFKFHCACSHRFLLIIVQKYFSIIVGSTCRESVCYAYYENMFILFLLVIIIKGEYNISYVLLNVVIWVQSVINCVMTWF